MEGGRRLPFPMGFVVALDVDGFKEGTSLVDQDFKVGSKGPFIEIC